MKRVFIIHRWDGGPEDDWRPWLKVELQKRGWEVHALEMPDTEVPVIEKWVKHLQEVVGEPDADTYFVGHSIGNQAILRYAEGLQLPVGGAVFVAGWFTLENLESDEVATIAEPWLATPIDIEKVKKVLPKTTVLISDNDPYGCFEYNKQKFMKLGSKVIVMHDAGHMTDEDGYTELPAAADELDTL